MRGTASFVIARPKAFVESHAAVSDMAIRAPASIGMRSMDCGSGRQ
jgi:hypothetical protein